MRREDLHIPEPCDADWDQMRGDDQRRFCDLCTKHVHNLSELPEHQARQVLAEPREHLCVQYTSSADGRVMFADTPDPRWRLQRQRRGASRLLGAAALLLTPLGLGCEEPPSTRVESVSPEAQAPLVLDAEQGVQVRPGAGRAPTFAPSVDPPSKTKTTPNPEGTYSVSQGEPMPIEEEPESEHVMGKIAPSALEPVRIEDIKLTEAKKLPPQEPYIREMGDVAALPTPQQEDPSCEGDEQVEGAREVLLETTPPHASVRLGGEVVGATPMRLELDASGEEARELTFSKPGYTSRTVRVDASETERVHVELEANAPKRDYTRTRGRIARPSHDHVEF